MIQSHSELNHPKKPLLADGGVPGLEFTPVLGLEVDSAEEGIRVGSEFEPEAFEI